MALVHGYLVTNKCLSLNLLFHQLLTFHWFLATECRLDQLAIMIKQRSWKFFVCKYFFIFFTLQHTRPWLEGAWTGITPDYVNLTHFYSYSVRFLHFEWILQIFYEAFQRFSVLIFLYTIFSITISRFEITKKASRSLSSRKVNTNIQQYAGNKIFQQIVVRCLTKSINPSAIASNAPFWSILFHRIVVKGPNIEKRQ